MAENADIRGLPLALGGEIRAVSKLEDKPESAVILVRGPAGSGKTFFASHLAAHEALVRGGDVVYCCIELLPSELDAQLAGLTFGRERRVLRVCNLPFGPRISPDLRPRIFSRLIDVPETGEPDFGLEVDRAINDARRAQHEPRVVVIDSLAEGYRLVDSMPRYLADALAKYAAEQGILLILVEEVAGSQDSRWTFVADVVLELAHQGAAGTSAAEQRSLTIRKNRFGPAHVGPHAFAIRKEGGIEVYPRPSVYLSDTAGGFLPGNVRRGKQSSWNLVDDSEQRIQIPQMGELILLTGEDASLVSAALGCFVRGSDFLLLDMADTAPSEPRILRCGDPVLSAERLLADFCTALGELKGEIRGVVMGDLEAVNRNIDPDALRRALPVLIRIARAAQLSVALFETTSRHAPLSTHLAETILHLDSHQREPKYFGASLSSRRRDQFRLGVAIPR